jgi:agmatinase
MGDDERGYAKKNRITIFGPEFNPKDIAKKFSGKRVYVSVDLDVLEPLAAPGVGNPEPGGLDFNKLKTVINDVVCSSSVVGLDAVELSPAYDSGGASAAAARIVADFMLK